MAVYVTDEQDEVTLDPDRLSRLAAHVLADRGVTEAMEVSIICVPTAEIAELNATHMGKDGHTDVLAFPLDQPGEAVAGDGILGDVVLCPAVARDQAPDHDRTPTPRSTCWSSTGCCTCWATTMPRRRSAGSCSA